ncbi:GNAT family N-acetyltransferase [Embleya sp. NPDC050154]|uniref:GNAT family N-acetyltransferase n=1 Tax=Embleya sp. NPDC050154 TaxID=3363988 RepID=UPI0037BB5C6C
MPSPPTAHAAIRANNLVWWCLYYDELLDDEAYQLTHLADADAFYNCAQAVSDSGDHTFAAVEDFYRRRGMVPALYTDPNQPEDLPSRARAHGYSPVPTEDELWFGYDLTDDTAFERPDHEVLRVEPDRVRILEIDPHGRDLDTFLRINGDNNDLSASVRSRLANNLTRRRLRGVELTLLLVTLDGEPVATGAMGLCRDMAFICESATEPHARRKGIYSALLRRRLETARESGARHAYLTTALDAQSGPAALKLGFEQVWRREYLRQTRTDNRSLRKTI